MVRTALTVAGMVLLVAAAWVVAGVGAALAASGVSCLWSAFDLGREG